MKANEKKLNEYTSIQVTQKFKKKILAIKKEKHIDSYQHVLENLIGW